MELIGVGVEAVVILVEDKEMGGCGSGLVVVV